MKKLGLNVGSIIGILGGIIGLLIGGYTLLNGITDNEKVAVNLGIKTEGKIYLSPNMSTSNFKFFNPEDSDSSPSITKATTIIEMEGDIYVTPEELENIIDLTSKEYTLFGRDRKNYDGYVTMNDTNNSIFSSTIIKEEGEKIGEQISKNVIQIKNKEGDIHSIKWSSFPKKDDVAEENCIMIPIRIADNYRPGATAYYSVDIVVVKLKTVLEFLNNGSDYKYDVDNEILYIIQ